MKIVLTCTFTTIVTITTITMIIVIATTIAIATSSHIAMDISPVVTTIMIASLTARAKFASTMENPKRIITPCTMILAQRACSAPCPIIALPLAIPLLPPSPCTPLGLWKTTHRVLAKSSDLIPILRAMTILVTIQSKMLTAFMQLLPLWQTKNERMPSTVPHRKLHHQRTFLVYLC
jgi:hypothetical protein